MGLDRRTFSIGIFALMTAACETNARSGSKAGQSWWARFRDLFLSPEGRIIDTGNGGISHSEGQGYGMVLAYVAGDRDAFARMLRWTEDHLARPDIALYSWRYDPRLPNPVADPNNATDGDMLIAWALGLAGQGWKTRAYLDRAMKIRAAIRRKCVIDRYGRALLLPGIQGFAETSQVVLNPSYFIWPALDAFARLDGDSVWGPVVSSCEDVLGLSKFGAYRLPADWVAITDKSKVMPAPGRPPRFGYDAIRVALYAAMGRRAGLANDIESYWRLCLSQNRPIPAWIDVVTGAEAHYAVSDGGAAIAAKLLGTAEPATLSSDYFAAALQMLAKTRF